MTSRHRCSQDKITSVSHTAILQCERCTALHCTARTLHCTATALCVLHHLPGLFVRVRECQYACTHRSVCQVEHAPPEPCIPASKSDKAQTQTPKDLGGRGMAKDELLLFSWWNPCKQTARIRLNQAAIVDTLLGVPPDCCGGSPPIHTALHTLSRKQGYVLQR